MQQNANSDVTRREFCGGCSAIAITTAVAGSPVTALASKIISEDEFSNYTLARYEEDVLHIGLESTWQKICARVLAYGEDGILRVDNFGALYETGLALLDKNAKKDNGQYYTPPDVSKVMSEWFDRCKGDEICDVGCGVGNLILSYFAHIGKSRTLELLKKGKVHLYDLDGVALSICVKSICILYGEDVERFINIHQGDFLDGRCHLPKDCKVITNPPYASIDEIPESWPSSEVISNSKELYAAFMEKILKESAASVIITPYSFIGGKMFYALRQVMNDHNGFVVSFDNVPGAIFCGRKHGIFNTNTGNSVRAAITVVENDDKGKGFRFSPLIRFKAVEREKLLKCGVLESFVGAKRQLVNMTHPMFAKCDRRLDDVFDAWVTSSESKLGLYLSKVGGYEMYVPNSCRYFTTASVKPLSRKGQITLCFSDEEVFCYVFCMINSSFAYWHWRLYDGGITYPKGLLQQMPVFYDKLSHEDKLFFNSIATEMINRANEFVITKSNVGIQENIKYPRKYRDEINKRLLHIIGVEKEPSIFDIVHSNMALEVSVSNLS